MSKKKVGIIIGVVAAVALVSVGGLYFGGVFKGNAGSSKDKVFVQTIKTIMQQNGGDGNRYSGVVEPQNSLDINKDGERTISEVFVKVGDEVAEGAQLFAYDTADLTLQLEQQKLELEDIDNEIANANTQIAELKAEKASAPADQQFDYTTQIQTAQTNIKQSEYNKKSKKAEMDKTQKAIDNSVVTSKIAGVVKSIDEDGVDDNGNQTAYMKILATGQYQIKGMINETNIGMMNAGDKVLIRSRVDEKLTWKGSVTKIDTENASAQGNQDNMSDGGNSDGTTTSTKYPFYVELESMDGLMMGQHVYIEPDMGQETVKDGIWLNSFYIVKDDGDPYVWGASEKNKLEKRKVELGDYDEKMDEYEIKSGLKEEDYIAWPMPGMKEGITTVTSQDEIDYSSPLYQNATESIDGGMMGTESPMTDSEMMMLEQQANEASTEPVEDMAPTNDKVPVKGRAAGNAEVSE